MSEYDIYMRFSTVQELKVKTVDTISETAAIDLAFEYEDEIFDYIKQKFGDSVELLNLLRLRRRNKYGKT